MTEGETVYNIAQKFCVSEATVKQNIAKFAAEIQSIHERTVDMGKLSDKERIKALEAENKQLRVERT